MALKATSAMTLPVHIQVKGGRVTASLLGAPDLQATEATREKAIAALRAQIGSDLAEGDLIFIDVEVGGVSALAGRYHDDDSLDEISAEAYRSRDAATEA